MKLTLTRLTPKDTAQIIGSIVVGEQQFHTLERPDLNNTPNISCIPKGTYKVKRDKLGRHQYYAVQDVPNRTFIEIHEANRVDQLQGCIALGEGFNRGNLVNSYAACQNFLKLVGEDDFELEIIDIDDVVVTEPVEVIEEVVEPKVKPKKKGKLKKALSKLVGSED